MEREFLLIELSFLINTPVWELDLLPEWQLRRYFDYFSQKSTPQRRLEFLLQQISYVQACCTSVGAKVDFSDFAFDKKPKQVQQPEKIKGKSTNPAFIGFNPTKSLKNENNKVQRQ